MSEHTFLIQPGTWKVRGHYWDAEGKIVPLEGKTLVAHGAENWTIQGRMKLLGQQNEIVNDYTVVPLGAGQRSTTWVSFNPALGRLEGTFTIVADTIISIFHSEDGRYAGTEMLVLQDPCTYHGRGLLTKAGALVGTWSIALVAN